MMMIIMMMKFLSLFVCLFFVLSFRFAHGAMGRRIDPSWLAY